MPTITPTTTANDPRDHDGRRLRQAMHRLGRDPVLRQDVLELLRRAEKRLEGAGAVARPRGLQRAALADDGLCAEAVAAVGRGRGLRRRLRRGRARGAAPCFEVMGQLRAEHALHQCAGLLREHAALPGDDLRAVAGLGDQGVPRLV